MAKQRRLTKEEAQVQHEEWQKFVNHYRRKTGGSTSEARMAWKEHLIEQEAERKAAQSQKLANLYHDPEFKKYLRGW